MTSDRNPEPETTDQDAEPTLNAPGDAGPTGREGDDGGESRGRGEADVEDQDAEPSQNAPGH